MGRRILIGLAPLVAATAAALPLIAHATPSAPHWLNGPQVIRNEEHVPVMNRGNGQKLTFTVTKAAASVTCNVAFRDVITNPLNETAGIDEMTVFQPTKCKGGAGLCPSGKVGIVALGLPWPSHLSTEVPAGAEGNNVIEGVALEFQCGGTKGAGIFKGMLSTLVKQLPNKPHCGGQNPHPCALFEYRGEPSLSGGSGTVAVSGAERIVGPRGEIQVCNCNQRGPSRAG